MIASGLVVNSPVLRSRSGHGRGLRTFCSGMVRGIECAGAAGVVRGGRACGTVSVANAFGTGSSIHGGLRFLLDSFSPVLPRRTKGRVSDYDLPPLLL